MEKIEYIDTKSLEKICKICKKSFKKNEDGFCSVNVKIPICPSCWLDADSDDPIFGPELDEISDKIFLGSQQAQKKKKILKMLDITNILVVGKELKIFHPNDFIYKRIEIDDDDSENIFKHFESTFNFINESEGNVYIHCMAGVSRSPTITIAYFMKKENMSFNEAYKFVKSKRIFIRPNQGFIDQLKEYEEYLKTTKI